MNNEFQKYQHFIPLGSEIICSAHVLFYFQIGKNLESMNLIRNIKDPVCQ